MADEEKNKKSSVSEVTAVASEIVKKLKEFVKEGNVRRVVIKKESGETLLDIPLTAGVLVSGGLVLFYPVIAAIAFGIGLFTKVKLEITKAPPSEKNDDEQKKQ
jgi:hypothetical protein